MTKRWAVALLKNTTIDTEFKYVSSQERSYDVLSYKPFRSFATRSKAREFIRNRKGNKALIVDQLWRCTVR